MEVPSDDTQQPNGVCVFMCFQDEKDMCEEEDLVGNKANISANRKRQLWWESRRGTDEKNVRQHPNDSPLKSVRMNICQHSMWSIQCGKLSFSKRLESRIKVCVCVLGTVIVVTDSSWKNINWLKVQAHRQIKRKTPHFLTLFWSKGL